MPVILTFAVIDFALDSVSIPAQAWAWIIVLWILAKSAQETWARRKKPVLVDSSGMDWLVSHDKAATYSTVDGEWQLSMQGSRYILSKTEDEFIILPATKLAQAFEQAEAWIREVSPER